MKRIFIGAFLALLCLFWWLYTPDRILGAHSEFYVTLGLYFFLAIFIDSRSKNLSQQIQDLSEKMEELIEKIGRTED